MTLARSILRKERRMRYEDKVSFLNEMNETTSTPTQVPILFECPFCTVTSLGIVTDQRPSLSDWKEIGREIYKKENSLTSWVRGDWWKLGETLDSPGERTKFVRSLWKTPKNVVVIFRNEAVICRKFRYEQRKPSEIIPFYLYRDIARIEDNNERLARLDKLWNRRKSLLERRLKIESKYGTHPKAA
jgi:hypothetical protein